MKKVISIVLAGALAASLAACGTSAETSENSQQPASETAAPVSTAETSDAPENLTLILRSGTYADVIKDCLPAFEKENNVKCEVLELSEDDLHSKIALDAMNKEARMIFAWWMALGWRSSPLMRCWRI